VLVPLPPATTPTSHHVPWQACPCSSLHTLTHPKLPP
jgi:hypothetical protein